MTLNGIGLGPNFQFAMGWVGLGRVMKDGPTDLRHTVDLYASARLTTDGQP